MKRLSTGSLTPEQRQELLDELRAHRLRLRGRVAAGDEIPHCAVCGTPDTGLLDMSGSVVKSIELDVKLIRQILDVDQRGGASSDLERQIQVARRELSATRTDLAQARQRVAELEAAAERGRG